MSPFHRWGNRGPEWWTFGRVRTSQHSSREGEAVAVRVWDLEADSMSVDSSPPLGWVKLGLIKLNKRA